uniref:LigA n=1 Tax=Parastrongyloides trichosuri TaxID=131310 RepID=A0A0N4ZEH0_PARTI
MARRSSSRPAGGHRGGDHLRPRRRLSPVPHSVRLELGARPYRSRRLRLDRPGGGSERGPGCQAVQLDALGDGARSQRRRAHMGVRAQYRRDRTARRLDTIATAVSGADRSGFANPHPPA